MNWMQGLYAAIVLRLADRDGWWVIWLGIALIGLVAVVTR